LKELLMVISLQQPHALHAPAQAAEEVSDALHRAVPNKKRLPLGFFVSATDAGTGIHPRATHLTPVLHGAMRTLGLLRMRLTLPESGSV
jgi:hypothetical protein